MTDSHIFMLVDVCCSYYQCIWNVLCLVTAAAAAAAAAVLRPSGFCLGLPGWSSTKKIKPIWFTGARGCEKQWHQLGHMQICTSPSPQAHNHVSIPPLNFFYKPDALLATQPTALKHWRQDDGSCNKVFNYLLLIWIICVENRRTLVWLKLMATAALLWMSSLLIFQVNVPNLCQAASHLILLRSSASVHERDLLSTWRHLTWSMNRPRDCVQTWKRVM